MIIITYFTVVLYDNNALLYGHSTKSDMQGA